MPTFTTPQPISVTLDLIAGDVKIVASDRSDTIVEVRSKGASGSASAAELTRVEFSDGRLLIKGPKEHSFFSSNKSRPIDVTIELPNGSNVQGRAKVGQLRVEGNLRECQFKTTAGDISVDHCGALTLETGIGDITVGRAAGQIEIAAASGFVSIQAIDGTAVIKHATGNTSIDEMTGELRLSAAHGDIAVGRLAGTAVAKTAKGNIRFNDVVRGSIQLETAYGELEIGIREGTAAWLDVSTRYGRVRNSLNTTAGPGQTNDTAKVRARTTYGDIAIRRPNRTDLSN
jgi:DUF4097 and DUF4098 domain-containing protein YvlB